MVVNIRNIISAIFCFMIDAIFRGQIRYNWVANFLSPHA